MSSITNLNLARKWRSKSFDQIVGQVLPIRMLKNSLYLESYFPVYLFSGQRGCGKTTMARVFAASVNCEQLPNFQKNPKTTTVPCLCCESCLAMQSGRHPDFIEIDAASYTGVDNVRHIIDMASLLPVLGRKKIYLIDEAHMLSKAAFNAFLKILEEPPASVIFILATTDAQKIIDTVKSRCFQLFFTPIDETSLSNHLAAICTAENIQFEPSGLQLIVKATEGSARDAINLLEQVRFSTSSVTKAAVLNVLGQFDDQRLVDLFKILLFKNSSTLLRFMHTNNIALYSADSIWQKLVELLRASLWIKHNVEPHMFIDHIDEIKKIVSKCSVTQLNELLDMFYNHEALFLKTTAQHGLLEMILLKICQKNSSDNSGSSNPSGDACASQNADDAIIIHNDNDDEHEDEENDDEDEVDTTSQVTYWQNFLHTVQQLNDPLLNSVFTQGIYVNFDADNKKLTIQFSKTLALFKDWLDSSAKLWKPMLDKAFGAPIVFDPHFTLEQKSPPEQKRIMSVTHKAQPASASEPRPAAKAQTQTNNYSKQPFTPYTPKKFSSQKESPNPKIDISDVTTWKKAHLVLSYFPGTIREIKESNHEQTT